MNCRGAPEFTPGFVVLCEVHVAKSLVFCVVFRRPLFLSLSPSLLAIVLSDYPFGIFKLCLVEQTIHISFLRIYGHIFML